MKILVTGATGFIAGYVIEELLSHDHYVIGIDNYSKYGEVKKSYVNHPHYKFIKGDVKDVSLLRDILSDCDQLIAGAAMIGGISYFHEYAYDLLAENERIIAATCDASIWAFQHKRLKKINMLSSSMVYESTKNYPTPEGEQLRCPPPLSTYGFQKLACEYFTKGAHEQYGMPFTIIRPFNCVGIGEQRALSDKNVLSGNIKLAMSHVVPDLVQKVLKGQNPLRIFGDGSQIRHYTFGGDLARGIRLCVEKEAAINEDFNLSTNKSTTVLELARLIWDKINPSKEFQYVCDHPFKYDVQRRVPSTRKALDVLGFNATTDLPEILDEVIPWVEAQIRLGNI